MDEERARKLLESERRRVAGNLWRVSKDVAEDSSGDELSTNDQHPAERATEDEDLSRDLALRADFTHLLAEVDAAQARLEEGRYGNCERCGRPIDDERLEALPATRLCLADQVGGQVTPVRPAGT